MAVLLKVKNSQTFIEKLNEMLKENTIGEKPDVNWIIEEFTNGTFYTFYTDNGFWNRRAWFRKCPDGTRKQFNDVKGTSYNLIFRLHGTKGDEMTMETYSFYHCCFVEFLLNNLMEEIKELSITAAKEDIEKLDLFKNYDWR